MSKGWGIKKETQIFLYCRVDSFTTASFRVLQRSILRFSKSIPLWWDSFPSAYKAEFFITESISSLQSRCLFWRIGFFRNVYKSLPPIWFLYLWVDFFNTRRQRIQKDYVEGGTQVRILCVWWRLQNKRFHKDSLYGRHEPSTVTKSCFENRLQATTSSSVTKPTFKNLDGNKTYL